jgi:hypothetical protein
MLSCHETTFRNRRAFALRNRDIEAIVYPGGGHVASLKLIGSDVNPLWDPPWPTIEPSDYDPQRHPEYGTAEGRLLASLAGHSICLDHFGELSPAEVAAGGYFHGEAPNLMWDVREHLQADDEVRLDYGVDLPEAGLRLDRRISLAAEGAQVAFEERLTNLRRRDTAIGYQQHITLGPPFVEPGVTRVSLPGRRGVVFPRPTSALERLQPGSEFEWPCAPGNNRMEDVSVFAPCGAGSSLCAVLQEPDGGEGFIRAINVKMGLELAYYFDAALFPWTALWEENCATPDTPYNSRAVAWGIEFGATPLPVSRMENLAAGPLFGKSRCLTLRARETIETKFRACLRHLRPGAEKGNDDVLLAG